MSPSRHSSSRPASSESCCSAVRAWRRGFICSRPRWSPSAPRSRPSGSWSTTAGCRRRQPVSFRMARCSPRIGVRSCSTGCCGYVSRTCCWPPTSPAPSAWRRPGPGMCSGTALREHAKLWGPLRYTSFHSTLIVYGSKAGVVLPEDALERAIQHGGANVEEGLHRRPVPAHLLLLVHAPGHDLVDRTLHERGRDRLTAPAPGRVVDQRVLVALEVAEQIADVPLETSDPGHVTQGF